jgi:cytochrome c
MKKFIVLSVLILLTLLVACTSSPSSPTPSPTPASGGNTYGALSNAGTTIYNAKCASCHGTNGQGVDAPALWGTGANLTRYNTAQGLLGYISATMPDNAPGSLSSQDYLDILAYLLIQNNDVSSSTTFDQSQLGNITLK